MPLNLPAQIILRRSNGDTHRYRRMPPDAFQDIHIPAYQRGFGIDSRAKAIPIQQLQRAPGKAQLFLKRVIGIAHGAGDHHALTPFAA